jgi:hypothetical protein
VPGPVSSAARPLSPGTNYLRGLAQAATVIPLPTRRPLAAAVAATSHAIAIAGGPSGQIPALVGFGGFGGAGKDAAATILSDQYGHRLLAFGTYVAGLLAQTNPLVQVAPGQTERAATLLDRLGYEGAKRVPDFLRLLQDLGTAINERDPGFWARLVLADVPAGSRSVITGIRSREQIAAVRDHGGLTIWVTRPGVGPRNGHKNEKQVSPEDYDVVLNNDGTLADLAVNLRRVLLATR